MGLSVPSNLVSRFRVLVAPPGGAQQHFAGDTTKLTVTGKAASGADAFKVEIGTMADGGTAVVVTPTKLAEPNCNISLAGDGYAGFDLAIDIVPGATTAPAPSGGALGLDVTAPETSPQPAPAA